jgi:uncharacterized protein (TIRG00374 family)
VHASSHEPPSPVVEAESDARHPITDAFPSEFSWKRIRRGLLVLVLFVAIVGVLVAVLPGLGSVRRNLAGAQIGWLLFAVLLQLGSCMGYVFAFRQVFCRTMPLVTSVQIGLAELAANSLLSVGGAGGLALGAWILSRAGMDPAHIARRTVAFFLLTSLVNVVFVLIAGIGLWTGVLSGEPKGALGLIPAIAAAVVILLALGLRRFAGFLGQKVSQRHIATTLTTIADGVDEALMLLRRRDPLLIGGALAYMLFDVAMLGVCFLAFGNPVPDIGVLLMAYLIGQLGGLIPLPGGVGGVDGGLIGTLVLYGAATGPAAVAVLGYRVIVLWVPALVGAPALAILRRRLAAGRTDIPSVTAP